MYKKISQRNAAQWPPRYDFPCRLKVAIRAAIVSLYNANAAPVHDVATQRDCGRGVASSGVYARNKKYIHIYNTHANRTTYIHPTQHAAAAR